MMNNEMMRQLQARIQKMQDDLATQTVEASAGGGAVTVTISEIGMGPAQARVQRVKISPEAVDPEDIETLEDLVVAAVNEALSKAQKVAAEKVAPLTGGLKLPGRPGQVVSGHGMPGSFKPPVRGATFSAATFC